MTQVIRPPTCRGECLYTCKVPSRIARVWLAADHSAACLGLLVICVSPAPSSGLNPEGHDKQSYTVV